MAYRQIMQFSATETGSNTGFKCTFSYTIYEDREAHKRRIYFDQCILHSASSASFTYNNFYTYDPELRVYKIENGESTQIYHDQKAFSSTVEQYGTRYARKTPAFGYVEVPYITANDGRYQISLSTLVSYTIAKKYQDGFYLSGIFVWPCLLTITPSGTVTLNAVNQFTVSYDQLPPSNYSYYYNNLTVSGAFGATLSKTADLYTNSTTKLTQASQLSGGFDWYPNFKDVTAGDFSGGVGQYKIAIRSTQTYSAGDFGSYYLVIGELTGQIVYNETPPAGAVTALVCTASVTETGTYTGILAQYGKYIYSISKLSLYATGSSSFGYGTTVTNVITLNGVSSTGSRTYSPPVGVGTWSITTTDNHGTTKTQTITWDTYDYSAPQLTTTAIHRCLQDGTLDDNGGYALIEWGTKVSPIGNQNSKALTIVQPEGTSSITPATYEATGSLIVEADTDQSYNIVYTLADDFKSVTKTLRLSTAYVLIDVYHTGRGIAIGKVCERDEKIEISSDMLMIMHTPGGQMIDVRASLIAGSVVYYTDPSPT